MGLLERIDIWVRRIGGILGLPGLLLAFFGNLPALHLALFGFVGFWIVYAVLALTLLLALVGPSLRRFFFERSKGLRNPATSTEFAVNLCFALALCCYVGAFGILHFWADEGVEPIPGPIPRISTSRHVPSLGLLLVGEAVAAGGDCKVTVDETRTSFKPSTWREFSDSSRIKWQTLPLGVSTGAKPNRTDITSLKDGTPFIGFSSEIAANINAVNPRCDYSFRSVRKSLNKIAEIKGKHDWRTYFSSDRLAQVFAQSRPTMARKLVPSYGEWLLLEESDARVLLSWYKYCVGISHAALAVTLPVPANDPGKLESVTYVIEEIYIPLENQTGLYTAGVDANTGLLHVLDAAIGSQERPLTGKAGDTIYLEMIPESLPAPRSLWLMKLQVKTSANLYESSSFLVEMFRQ